MALKILWLLPLAALLAPGDCAASGQLNIPVSIRGLPFTRHNAQFACYVYDAAGLELGSGSFFFYGLPGTTLEATISVIVRRSNAAAGAPDNYNCGVTIYGGTEGERGTVGHGGTTLPWGFNIGGGGDRVGRATRAGPQLMGGLAWGMPGQSPHGEISVVLFARKGTTMNQNVRGYLPARFIQSLASVETRPAGSCPCGCGAGGEEGGACKRDGAPLRYAPDPDWLGSPRAASTPDQPPPAKHRASRIEPLSERYGLGAAPPPVLAGTGSFVPQLTTDAFVFTGTGVLTPVPPR